MPEVSNTPPIDRSSRKRAATPLEPPDPTQELSPIAGWKVPRIVASNTSIADDQAVLVQELRTLLNLGRSGKIDRPAPLLSGGWYLPPDALRTIVAELSGGLRLTYPYGKSSTVYRRLLSSGVFSVERTPTVEILKLTPGAEKFGLIVSSGENWVDLHELVHAAYETHLPYRQKCEKYIQALPPERQAALWALLAATPSFYDVGPALQRMAWLQRFIYQTEGVAYSLADFKRKDQLCLLHTAPTGRAQSALAAMEDLRARVSRRLDYPVAGASAQVVSGTGKQISVGTLEVRSGAVDESSRILFVCVFDALSPASIPRGLLTISKATWNGTHYVAESGRYRVSFDRNFRCTCVELLPLSAQKSSAGDTGNPGRRSSKVPGS